MGKIKVLFISHTSRTAGAERCLLTLVRYLDREKFEPVVVLPRQGPLAEELEAVGVRTVVSPLEWWARPPRNYGLLGSDIEKRVRSLVAVCQRERPAVVHTNTSVIWEGALAAAFAGIPHVWHLHERLCDHPSIKTLFPLEVVHALIGKLAARVVTVSESVRSEIGGVVAAGKVAVIHNGVTIPEVAGQDAATALRAELQLPEDVTIAVSVGALIPEKGYDTLIDAAALLRNNGKIVFVVVGAGEGDAVTGFQDRAAKAGISASLRYLGYRTDARRIIAGADLLVLPSRSEAFPLVVLEAMAAGKPVVATDCGGPREMVVPDETGVLVPLGDAAALARGIEAVASDGRLAQRLGARAQERFRREFTAERYAARFGELYRDIVAAAPPAFEEKERIFLEGLMDTYQRIACHALAAGVRRELANFVRRAAALPLRPVQWAMDMNKRHRR